MASSSDSTSTIRSGYVSLKTKGVFTSWIWKRKWLVLKQETLEIRKSQKSSRPQSVITLKELKTVERTDLKPCCVLLETKKKRYYLDLTSDNELYGWQDDIYNRSPLGASLPFNFVHNKHVGFDSLSGNFTGLTEELEKALAEPPPATPQDPKEDQVQPRSSLIVGFTGIPEEWNKDLTKSTPSKIKRKPVPEVDVGNPYGFAHNAHVGFDPVTGKFTGLPEEWSKVLSITSPSREDYAKGPEPILALCNKNKTLAPAIDSKRSSLRVTVTGSHVPT
ncbi:hypothetical protein IW261DRAFT_1507637 [Armillaria novae-zelandiae]|uniref:non-specific serine/threonine protein kinase n=1 Tax=Armillaria novae-zelandiae TaxID=153914 RepID=A0AA39NVF9_9AGAR|nr:hypothetical protein IW261DRAFT_1507637 [Armillaria novae-zelandiae]